MSKKLTIFNINDVVTLRRGRRRYIITHICPVTSRPSMVALSGGFAGCAPSCVDLDDIRLSPNQTIEFTGKKASYLRQRVMMQIGRV